LNYDDKCTSSHLRSGTYEISGHLIFVEQSVHVHSCTCRCTVLCYTVLPLYTRRLILKRQIEMFSYTSKIIHYIWAKAN